MTTQTNSSLILIVDDDKIIRALMRRILGEDGHTIAEAENGQQGLEAFNELKPDLVLLDAMMPVMDGFEACKRIKAMPLGDATPVLMITALQDNKSVTRAFEVGATDFIPKPVHWTVLRQRVKRVLHEKQIEEELRESEAHYRSLFDDSPISIWEEDFSQVKKFLDHLRDEKGVTDYLEYFDAYPADVVYCASLVRVLNINENTAKLFGATSKQDLLQNLTRIFCDESYPAFKQELVFLGQGKTSFEVEVINQTLSGRKIDVLVSFSVAPGHEETLDKVRLSLVDFTERKKAEQALRENEARFRNVVTSISDHIYVSQINANGQFKNRYVSPNMEKLLGYSTQKVMDDWGFWANALVHPDDRPLAAQQTRQLSTTNSSETEYRMVRADGEIIWVRDSARVDIEDDLRVVYGVVSDISERKRSEEVMLASQKLADLGTLAAGVAHEINSPLQVITGVSQSLQKRLGQNKLNDEFLQRKLDVIHRNGWRCAEIVRSLKTYAHASTIQFAPGDLNEIVKDTLLLTEHQLKSWSNIAIATRLIPDLPPMHCDRNQISQIIINLLTNARDAMPDGGEITISTGYNETAREFLLSVADNGPGIPEAMRNKIFDPFFTTKPIGAGTGLGLSIIAGVIRVHSGEIEVQSTPSVGTTFLMKFPNSPDLADVANLTDGVGRFADSVGIIPGNSAK